MIVLLCTPTESSPPTFTPPPFDTSAQIGEPSVPEEYGYNLLYKDGMSFKVGLCGKVLVRENTADVYFTSPADNTPWLKLRVFDAKGNIIGETGLIRPGEYIKSIEFTKTPQSYDGLIFKIMSYEPDTYNSLGAIQVTPKIVK